MGGKTSKDTRPACNTTKLKDVTRCSFTVDTQSRKDDVSKDNKSLFRCQTIVDEKEEKLDDEKDKKQNAEETKELGSGAEKISCVEREKKLDDEKDKKQNAEETKELGSGAEKISCVEREKKLDDEKDKKQNADRTKELGSGAEEKKIPNKENEVKQTLKMYFDKKHMGPCKYDHEKKDNEGFVATIDVNNKRYTGDVCKTIKEAEKSVAGKAVEDLKRMNLFDQ